MPLTGAAGKTSRVPCILKALITWLVLLVVSGMVGLFLRRAVYGVVVPFPEPSTNPAVEEALREMHRSYRRSSVANTIFCFAVSAAYLWAVFHFTNALLAVVAFLIMVVTVEHYAQTPAWVRLTGDVILWGSSVVVWYSVCKQI